MRRESSTVVVLVGSGPPEPPASTGTSRPGTGRPSTSRPGTGRPGTGGPGTVTPRTGGPSTTAGRDVAGRQAGATSAAGIVTERLLAELDSATNIALVRAPAGEADAVTAASVALSQAARRSAPFALVPADPLAAVAAQWQAMWDLTRGGVTGAALFEQEAGHALSAWRARRFELPDYYVVLADPPTSHRPPTGSAEQAETGTDFYLGPLRAARAHRVAVVAAADAAEQAAEVRAALRSLPHGPWWPSLDELLETARRFFPGSLAESPGALASAGRPTRPR